MDKVLYFFKDVEGFMLGVYVYWVMVCIYLFVDGNGCMVRVM